MKKASEMPGIRESFAANKRAFLVWWKTEPMLFVSTAAVSFFGTLTPYLLIYFTARLLDEISGQRRMEELARLALILLAATAALSFAEAVMKRWKNTVFSTYRFLKNRIFTGKFMEMDFSAIDDPHTHELFSQVEVNERYGGWGMARILEPFGALLDSLMKIAGAVVLCVTLFTQKVPEGSSLAFLNHPLFLTGLLLLMIGVAVCAPLLANRTELGWVRLAKQMQYGNRVYTFNGFLGKNRERALDIRTYRQDLFSGKKLSENRSFAPDSEIAGWFLGEGGLCYALSVSLSRLFTGIVYLYVCLKAWGGAFGIGSVTQYVSAITALFGGVEGLLRCMGTLRNNVPYLKTAFEFLDIKNEMYQGSLSVEKRADRKYEVEFRNVSFRYPSADTFALEHVSLKFKVGERLAVVGPNGSGKTTMIKLLCRLYDPTEGQILLNGIDIRKYNYAEYMNIFSVVFQDFQLLAYSLGQNVAGRKEYDAARAAACVRDAGLGARLATMPKGLDTCIGKDFDKEGAELSGGEAQKAAIARALYKDSPFIVLDEPTASLDPIAEAEVYSRFDTLIRDKTAIYISHRLSSCRFCDRIAVFDGGRVVQFGNHEELAADRDGKYYELWQAQAQYYT